MGARRGAAAGLLARRGRGRDGSARAAPPSLLRARPGDVRASLLSRGQRAERASCRGRRPRIDKGEAGAVPGRASDFEDGARPDGSQRSGTDVRICHLGDLGHKLDDVEAEAVSSPDVLLVPVGGRSAMNAAQAAEVVRQLEPRYVVPMHYAIPGLKLELDPIDRFLKEMGVTASEPQPKLAVQKSSVSEYETKVVVLEPKAEVKV